MLFRTYKCMKIIWYNTIESTNSAMENSRSNLRDREVWAARFQSAGKGQKGNVWCSNPGDNLTFSVYLRHNGIAARDQFVICQGVSLGVCDYLAAKGVAASIKWPNDIYVGDKKICGILISNTVGGEALIDTVAGIGLNLNQRKFPDWIPNPISLIQLTGNIYVIEDELPLLIKAILAVYDADGGDTAGRYLSKLYLKDYPHRFTDTASGDCFEGIITGVKNDGRLEVKTADGLRYFAFKEIAY